MKKSLLTLLCLVAMGATSSALALEISKPSLNSLKQVAKPQVSSQKEEVKFDPSGTIGYINNRLYEIDKQVQEAYDSLFSALLSKKDYNKYKAELKIIQDNKNLSESEKSAKLSAVAIDTSAILAKEELQTEFSNNLKALSIEKRTEYINAFIDLTLAGFEYKNLADECKALSMSISSNPKQAISLAFELGQVKDTAALLKSNLKSLGSVSTQVLAINKANGIEIKLPENKSSKAKKVSF